MKVYIEQVLLTNFIIDFCILVMISKLVFSKPNFKRITISATFGSVATLIYPLCTNMLLGNALKILVAVIMLQILNIRTKKQLMLSSLLMLALSYIIGGAVLSNFGCNIGGGYVVNNVSLIPIFAITIIYTFVCYKLISYVKLKITSNSNIYDITLVHNGNKITIKSFIDSGNGLLDDNHPVSLINFDTFTRLTNITLNQYLTNNFILPNSHYITANTIAGNRKILVFTIDELYLNKSCVKKYQNVRLGVTMHFDNTKEYKAILNSSFCLN